MVRWLKLLLERGDNVALKAGIDVRFEYVDKETGTVKTLFLPIAKGFKESSEIKDDPLNSNQENELPVPGELNFGDGNIFTLEELVRLAERTYNIRFELDGRLRNSLYFVCGSMGRQTFEKAIDVISTTQRTVSRELQSVEFMEEIHSLLNSDGKIFADAFDARDQAVSA
jgi:hypothetical protein